MFKTKVLVIDDEADFGLLLKSHLSKRGYEVSISPTLKEGMEALEVFHPDYLFLDNNLPDGLGWEKTESVLNRFPHIRIILISAYQHDNFSPQKFPSVRIWEKPIKIADLNSYLS